MLRLTNVSSSPVCLVVSCTALAPTSEPWKTGLTNFKGALRKIGIEGSPKRVVLKGATVVPIVAGHIGCSLCFHIAFRRYDQLPELEHRSDRGASEQDTEDVAFFGEQAGPHPLEQEAVLVDVADT